MLTEYTLLQSVSRQVNELLSTRTREIALGAHEVLFEEDDAGDSLYVVLDGRIEISLLWEDGRRLWLDVMTPGAVFGEIALFDPGPRTATARALEPTKLAELRHDDLMAGIATRPELAVEILHLMGQRMRWMNQQLHEYVFMPLPARLARKLLHLVPDGVEGPCRLSLSQTELADFAGATREAVSKTLSGWTRQGLVKTGRGAVELLDMAALRAIAGL